NRHCQLRKICHLFNKLASRIAHSILLDRLSSLRSMDANFGMDCDKFTEMDEEVNPCGTSPYHFSFLKNQKNFSMLKVMLIV
ncbi:MAG: hypothetical protein ACXU9L_10240, partial [Thermodesulfobacteriota bacterium]